MPGTIFIRLLSKVPLGDMINRKHSLSMQTPGPGRSLSPLQMSFTHGTMYIIPAFFSRKRGKLISYQSRSITRPSVCMPVRASVTFLIIVSSPKPLKLCLCKQVTLYRGYWATFCVTFIHSHAIKGLVCLSVCPIVRTCTRYVSCNYIFSYTVGQSNFKLCLCMQVTWCRG